MLRVKKNQSGFSLVELMVVVAIIGILAAVAIPNFTRFQRKARVAEAKDVLTGQFNAEQGFLAEWEGYTDNLFLAGYRTEGALRTNAGFNSAGAVLPSTIITQAQKSITDANTACTGAADTVSVALICGKCLNAACTFNSALSAFPVLPAGAFTATNATDGTATFTVVSSTNVGSTQLEEWTLNNGKTLTQLQDGVNVN
jgi:type IV pilus assembly protein PilA